jgi:hypothetical protein
MTDNNELNSGFLRRPAAYTYPLIFQRMLFALSEHLPRLKTHNKKDPTIALLDAWAITLDVLSFYQQQFNQESYLDQATELTSIRHLARMVDYEISPGVAANTFLAFEIDPSANHTGTTLIPQGTQVQSMPTNSEQPQTFETSTNFTANASWNQLQPYQPQQPQLQVVTGQTTHIWLAGVSNGLSKGDVLLLTGNCTQNGIAKTVNYALTVQTAITDAANHRTQVTWQADWAVDSNNNSLDLSGNGIVLGINDMIVQPQLSVFRRQVGSFGSNAPLVGSLSADSYYRQKGMNDWDGKSQVSAPNSKDTPNPKGDIPTVWQDSQAKYFNDTNTFTPTIYLNQSLSNLVANSYILLSMSSIDTPRYNKLYKLQSAQQLSRADFGLSNPSTRLTLKDLSGGPDNKFLFRATAIYAQSEPLTLYAELVDTDETLHDAKQGIILDSSISPALQPGQPLIISNSAQTFSEVVQGDGRPPHHKKPVEGSAADEYIFNLTVAPKFDYQPGTITVTGSNIADPIAAILDISTPNQPVLIVQNTAGNPIPPGTTQLTLSGMLVQKSEVLVLDYTREINNQTILYPKQNLTNYYHPAITTIYGNVISATHGETVAQEVLGSGDATQTNQKFSLRNLPLTYVSAFNTNNIIPGVNSTLSVQVNQVTWKEAPDLYNLKENSKNYVVTQEDSGQVTITFGDGVRGARLPTGQENITATYRQGIGRVGNVPANSLTLLKSRPQGVKSVTNPIEAVNGTDAESPAGARYNANNKVQIMDRLVSRSDFQNYINAYTGISNSQVDLLQVQGKPVLYATLVGQNGVGITANDPIYTNLLKNILAISQTSANIQISNGYQALFFNVTATLTLDPAYPTQQVLDLVSQNLLKLYTFDQQYFATNVTAGKIIKAINQASPAVLAVDLTELYIDGQPAQLNNTLVAKPAQVIANSTIVPAQLLLINPKGIHLSVQP